MRFSVFESDNTLGVIPPVDGEYGGVGLGVGSGSGGAGLQSFRSLKIRLTGSFYLTSNLFTNGDTNIRNTLVSKGWNISRVQGLDNTYYPGQSLNFYVYANVGSQYSDVQITNQMRDDLEDIMTVQGVAIVQSTPVAYVSGSSSMTSTSGPISGQNIPSNPTLNFGSALGLSTPIALVGGGILLLLILRR